MAGKNVREGREVLTHNQPCSCSIFPETLSISALQLKWPAGNIPSCPFLFPAPIFGFVPTKPGGDYCILSINPTIEIGCIKVLKQFQNDMNIFTYSTAKKVNKMELNVA
jgi:hypothetical protein